MGETSKVDFYIVSLSTFYFRFPPATAARIFLEEAVAFLKQARYNSSGRIALLETNKSLVKFEREGKKNVIQLLNEATSSGEASRVEGIMVASSLRVWMMGEVEEKKKNRQNFLVLSCEDKFQFNAEHLTSEYVKQCEDWSQLRYD